MAEGVRFTGIPSAEELAAATGIPSEERLKQGRVAVIECVQEIPCNPCESACKFGAITVGKPITNLPCLHEEKCVGCGRCVAMCPGQAIFLLNYNYSETEAEVSFPYEYLPVPEKGDVVKAVGRDGQYVCDGVVTSVVMPEAYKNTHVVSIAIPKEYINTVRSMKHSADADEAEAPAKKDTASRLVCRCMEVTREDIEAAIAAGATTVDGVKRMTHAGMGLCQGKTCERLVARIISEKTGLSMAEIIPATKRAPVRPISMGVMADAAEQQN
ncbi:MAG: (2Fe-2S)-binding protein [Lachnospiraceae bacterium]|nr:(2Fe-2S)-binding protein [Lachnospiraceae bacterium]